ncbi:hypothetical protein OUZ56_032075 [Daphnia magna]|uniref:DUF4806 domain-containing protein n=1 Tax=Daphnia magna TaxID=35525 RepID=A0ABQ9ZW59_9CRUS|nr:hypothetical protein OUZ56_032075 [Daphnia magna]
MASPTPFRTSTRERRVKQLDGYVDASFSETEEPLLYSPPSPPSTLVGISGRSVSNDSLRSPPAKRGPPKRIPHPRPWKPSPQNLNNFSQYRSHTSKPTTVPGIAAQKKIADVTKKSAAMPRQSAIVPGLNANIVNPDNQRRNAHQHSSSVQNVEGIQLILRIFRSAPLSYPDIGTCPIQIPLQEVSLVRNDRRKPQHYFPVSEAHRTRPAIEQRAEAENREGEAIRSKRDSNSDQDFRSYAKRNFEYIKVHLRELTSAVETLTLAVNQRDVTDKIEDTANILGFEFPLNDIETMKELENLLSTGDVKTRLVVLLGRVGGDVVSSTTYRVMAKLMTNRLGTEITWTGRSKPNEFKHKMLDMPRIFAEICDAVRFHPRLKEATDDEVYTSVKEWLRHSIDRNKVKPICTRKVQIWHTRDGLTYGAPSAEFVLSGTNRNQVPMPTGTGVNASQLVGAANSLAVMACSLEQHQDPFVQELNPRTSKPDKQQQICL